MMMKIKPEDTIVRGLGDGGYGYVLTVKDCIVIYSPTRINEYHTSFSWGKLNLTILLDRESNISIVAVRGTVIEIVTDNKGVLCSNSSVCELLRDENGVIAVEPRRVTLIVNTTDLLGGKTILHNLVQQHMMYLFIVISTTIALVYVLSMHKREKQV